MVPTSLRGHSAQQYAVYAQMYFLSSKRCLEKEPHTVQLFFFKPEIKLVLGLKCFLLNLLLSE